MKKSNKKVKSDRINALRKHYDDFLEEEKKRKERNDLILNKLYKMSYLNATTPLRTMPTLNKHQKIEFHSKGKPPEQKSSNYDKLLFSPTQHLPLELSKRRLDDSIMLQEITKKYILIPKRSSVYVNEYSETIKPVLDSDYDWKSKYDILNQLKQSDKVERDEEKESPIKENKYLKNYDSSVKILRNEPLNNKYESEIPKTQQQLLVQHTDGDRDKDVIDTKINESKNENHDHYEETTNNLNDNYNKIQNVSPVTSNDKNYKEDKEITEPKKPHNSVEPEIDSKINVPINNAQEFSELYINKNQNGNEPVRQNELETEIKNFTHHNNLNSIPEKISDFFYNESTKNDLVNTKEIKQNEDTEYPIDIINVQEYTPNENENLGDDVNINTHIDLEDSLVPEKSQNKTDVEEENDINTSGIEAFETEQREMFYSDQPNDNIVNDQTNPANTYQEYPQDENYQQNEEYAYYEGDPLNQTYNTEVNEFEETSQPYDQTYQEQYAAYDPEYVQQEAYEQQSLQYEGIQEIDPNIQPEMEQLQYDQIQNVEQQLDNEQGYAENEELGNTCREPVENTENEDLNSQACRSSELQENIIQENTLNN